jgi:hypothetical protein
MSKKQSIYNLGEEEELTHLGTSLGLKDDYVPSDEELAGPDDEGLQLISLFFFLFCS